MARDPIEMLDKLAQALDKRVGDILYDCLTLLRDFVKALELLKRRTRGMPYVRRPIQLQGNLIEAGLYAPPKWAEVHIGPAGSETVITAKGNGMLAIPTDFARRGAGGKPVGPKAYNGLVCFGGILWGKAGWGGAQTGGGLRQRRAAGERFSKQTLIPLFILEKSVIVGKRIDPRALIAWIKPLFLAKLKEACLLDQL